MSAAPRRKWKSPTNAPARPRSSVKTNKKYYGPDRRKELAKPPYSIPDRSFRQRAHSSELVVEYLREFHRLNQFKPVVWVVHGTPIFA